MLHDASRCNDDSARTSTDTGSPRPLSVFAAEAAARPTARRATAARTSGGRRATSAPAPSPRRPRRRARARCPSRTARRRSCSLTPDGESPRATGRRGSETAGGRRVPRFGHDPDAMPRSCLRIGHHGPRARSTERSRPLRSRRWRVDDRGWPLSWAFRARHARGRYRPSDRAAGRNATELRNGATGPVVRIRVRREPVPRSKVPVGHKHSARPVVTRNEPPDVPVEVPARRDEHVVHAFLDAVPVDPNVLPIAVVPISVDPNPARTVEHRIIVRHDPRRRRRFRAGGDGLGLLHDDDRLAFVLRRRPRFRFDDRVRGRLRRLDPVTDTAIPIVRHVVLNTGLARRIAGSRRPPSLFRVVRESRPGPSDPSKNDPRNKAAHHHKAVP